MFFKSVLSSLSENTEPSLDIMLNTPQNEERDTFKTLKAFPSCQNRYYFYFLEAKFIDVSKMC